MTDITANTQADTTEEKGKAAKDGILSALKKASRSFWAYTEVTGEADTKSFKGLL